MIIRCDSAAIVLNTSELLPEPETPVNTVSRRLGSSTWMSLRLFSRAPCTRIRSWVSATRSSGDRVLGALLILSPPSGAQTSQRPSRMSVRPDISLASRQACTRTGRSTRNT